MQERGILTIHLSKHGRPDFEALLRQSGIGFAGRPMRSGIFAAAQTIEIIDAVGAIVTPLAAVLVTWLKANASRKITIDTQKGIVSAQGLTQAETEEALKIAKALIVVQSEATHE